MKNVIAIGVNNASGLTPLEAAISGAKSFTKWAETQEYTVSLFTDENGPLSRSDIFKKIRQIIDVKTCEQLIIYFSGHGILNSPSQEVWILSDSKIDPSESINLTTSIDYARSSGIPHVIFISDACRVLTDDIKLSGSGSSIFPILDDNNQDTIIDTFYATRPGSPANEIKLEESAKKFGIFSECLLSGLNGEYPEILYSKSDKEPIIAQKPTNEYYFRNQEQNSDWLIRSENLRNLLKITVPETANKKSILLTQNPEIRIESAGLKSFVASFESREVNTLIEKAKNRIKENGFFNEDTSDFTQTIAFELIKESSILEGQNSFNAYISHFEADPSKKVLEQSEKIYNAKGRESFETSTGFTVVGAKIIKAIPLKNRLKIFKENEHQQIRLHKETPVLLILENGNSIPVATLQGFIGTLVFENNLLMTINYTPSRNTWKYNGYKRNESEISFVRAFVAASAMNGFDYEYTFKNEFKKDRRGNLSLNNSGSFLRREKSLDPSLGLYAAYAFAQLGRAKENESVFSFMVDEPEAMIYDVAMLAQKIPNVHSRLSPFCPMIALGWAYRNRFEEYLHPAVKEASKYLVPSLWTTFAPEGTEILKKAILNKELKA